jgi:hypothetical protein
LTLCQIMFQPRFDEDNEEEEEEETSFASPLSFHKQFQSKCYQSQSRKMNNDCSMPGLALFCHGSFVNGSGVTGGSVASGASAMFSDFTDSITTLECSAKNGFDEMMTSQHHKSISILEPIAQIAAGSKHQETCLNSCDSSHLSNDSTPSYHRRRLSTGLHCNLAKSCKISNLTRTHLPHVITTRYMKTCLERVHNHGYQGPVWPWCRHFSFHCLCI